MTTRLPTFSGIGRAMKCRASCVLPAADSVSEYAESGTVMHTFLQRAPTIGVEAAIAEAPEDERAFLAAIPVAELPTDAKAFAQEVALAYDAATGKCREIGRDLARNYGTVSPTEFVGTADLVALMDADGVFVGDWKKRGRYVTAARDNWQLKAGIVAACGAWGRSRGQGEIIRIFEDGEPYRDRAEFSAADVEQARVDLSMLALRIFQDRKAHKAGEAIPATTGDHCRYCPSFQFCPSNLSLARRMAAEPAEVQGELVALVTRETAPDAVRALKQAKAVVKAVEDALDALASQAAAAGAPIEMGDGLVFAPVPKPRESIDGDKAKAVLEAEGLAEAVTFDVTKASVKKALQRKLPGGKGITEAEKAVLEKLRAAGAVKRTVSYSCDVVPAKKLSSKSAA